MSTNLEFCKSHFPYVIKLKMSFFMRVCCKNILHQNLTKNSFVNAF